MSIRVGSIKYPNYAVTKIKGYEIIYVMTPNFPGDYNQLSPFAIKDEHGRIMENIWQFSRIFPKTFKTVKPRTFKDKSLKESTEDKISLIDEQNIPTDDYMIWRRTGANYPKPIRYSNGLHDKKSAICAYKEKQPILSSDTIDIVRNKLDLTKQLDYIESRKQIYVPLYINIVKNQPKFTDLKQLLNDGKNLLIIEVDGPHQESLDYYKKKYGVSDDFITNNSMLINQTNINIMLNDSKHNFGHGYCLAMALLDLDCN